MAIRSVRWWLAGGLMLAGTMSWGQAPGWINYQGRLLQGTNLVNGNIGLSLRLCNSAIGAGILYEDSNTVTVVDGLYNTFIGDQTNSGNLATALQQDAVWLEVVLDGVALVPRERVASVAYALIAGGVRTGGVTAAMLADGAVTGGKIAGASISNNHLAVNSVTSSNLVDGTIAPSDLAVTQFSNTFWLVGGNAGVAPGVHFVGTTDHQPLDLRANNQRGLRLQYTAEPGFESINVIGGNWANTISTAVIGGVVSGGGLALYPNRVTDNGGTVGGGLGNVAGDDDGDNTDSAASATVAGGENNRAAESFATVGGGRTNTAAQNYATVAGGRGNRALGSSSAIAGGWGNTATGDYSSVAGGQNNTAAGQYAAVPGGSLNTALGNYSLAAGQHARAAHEGAFVWADGSSAADFSSSSSNQFLIRATGGTGIGTTNPQARLHVLGGVLVGSAFTATTNNAANILNLLGGTSSNGAVNGITFWENNAGSLGMSLGYDGSLAGDENALLVYNHVRGGLVRFEDGGNVGIGVEDAAARLEVYGGNAAEPVLLVQGAAEATTNASGPGIVLQAGQGGAAGTISSLAGSGGNIDLAAGQAGGGGLGASGGEVRLTGGASSLLGSGGDIRLLGGAGIIPGDVLLGVDGGGILRGRVGIGVTLPSAHLHVVGETNLGVVMISPRKSTDGEDARLLLTEDTDGTFGMGFFYDGGSNMLQVVGIVNGATNGPHLIIARDTGRVGIGTLNLGTHQLSVGGSIHAEEVVVESGWADYVFAPGYPLPPLAEVRKSIEEKGHLPGIPSAGEVQAEGLGLGAMQTLMMQKIEELTLYTLRQQDELDRLRAEVQALRREAARE